MNPEEHNALPQELEDSLRALGDVRAPSELADRVRLARLGQVSAPAELEERVRAEVRQLTRPVLAFPFRLTLPRAAAAAVLVVGSIMLGPWSSTETAPVDPGAYLAAKNAAAEKVLMVRVSADELSEGAQSLARGFGAPLERGGAQ